MEQEYNPRKAAKAQEMFCDAVEAPCFAPHDGVCYNCCRNIYIPFRDGRENIIGYSVEYASAHVITRCPYCGRSFCD